MPAVDGFQHKIFMVTFGKPKESKKLGCGMDSKGSILGCEITSDFFGDFFNVQQIFGLCRMPPPHGTKSQTCFFFVPAVDGFQHKIFMVTFGKPKKSKKWGAAWTLRGQLLVVKLQVFFFEIFQCTTNFRFVPDAAAPRHKISNMLFFCAGRGRLPAQNVDSNVWETQKVKKMGCGMDTKGSTLGCEIASGFFWRFFQCTTNFRFVPDAVAPRHKISNMLFFG